MAEKEVKLINSTNELKEFTKDDPEASKLVNGITDCQKQIAELLHSNEVLVNRIQYLDTNSLIKQLEKIKDTIKFGYYKNEEGEFVHIRGIEIYGNTGDLCRMGYNGENHGVFIHYTHIQNGSITSIDVPTYTFTINFNAKAVGPKKVLVECTKEEYEAKVLEVIEKANKDYVDPEGVDWKDVMEWVYKFHKVQDDRGDLADKLGVRLNELGLKFAPRKK